MYNVHDFIAWALTHAKGGAEPWNYLFGSVRVRTDQATLDRYFKSYYSAHGYTRERFDALTVDWPRDGYATDCQGLLDAWLTYERGEQTDINADMNYRLWCTEKGKIDDINRGWVIGEAVFRKSGSRMTHIGWICGFDGGEPLVVEAKGIAYGVVVTHLYDGRWTHRGIMSKIFDYTEAKMIKFEVTSPMHSGMEYAKMQDVLNAAGYTDYDGKPLEADGKWGKRSQSAFDKMIADYAPEAKPEPEEPAVEVKPITTITSDDGRYAFRIFRTEDLPEADV